MKVLYITPWFPREDNPTSGVFVKELACAASRENEVAVLYAYPQRKGDKLYSSREDAVGGLRVFYAGYRMIPPISYLQYAASVFIEYRKLRKTFSPDIIHAHVYRSALVAVGLGKLYGVTVVATEHAEVVDTYRTGPLQRAKNLFSVAIARLALNNADMLILVSESVKEHLESIGVRNRTEIVPNIVDTETFHPGTGKRDNAKKKVLYVGALSPVKGVEYLIRAAGIVAKNRSDFTVDIVGAGGNRKEYEELASSLGLGGTVSFHGGKSKDEVAEYMRRCDFFVLPSVYETFGVVLIEAMACGKPVISTSGGGQKEIIDDRNGLLVPPRDAPALAKAIDWMLDHFGGYDSKAISRYAEERFSPAVVAGKLSRAYADARENATSCGSSRRPA